MAPDWLGWNQCHLRPLAGLKRALSFTVLGRGFAFCLLSYP